MCNYSCNENEPDPRFPWRTRKEVKDIQKNGNQDA